MTLDSWGDQAGGGSGGGGGGSGDKATSSASSSTSGGYQFGNVGDGGGGNVLVLGLVIGVLGFLGLIFLAVWTRK